MKQPRLETGSLPTPCNAAERCLIAGSNALQEYPYACMSLLIALEEHQYPVKTVIVRGQQNELIRWRKELAGVYQPRQQTFFIDNDTQNLPDAIAAKSPMDTAVAYVCEGMTCSEPVRQAGDLIQTTS